MQKFLVIQTAFVGDAVLATAIAEKLHRFYPSAEIDMLVRKGNEGLLNNHPFIHEVLIWNKKEHKTKNLFHLLQSLRRKKYDVVVNLQRFLSTGIITAFSGAKEKIGFDKNPLSFLFTKKVHHDLSNKKHEVERNDILIESFTDSSFQKPRLYPSQQDFDAIKKYNAQPYVCMMPASVWFTKQYPADKWIDLINNFSSAYTIYLCGGKEDVFLCETIKKKCNKVNVHVLAGALNFLQSVALMKTAHMNYTNDSAPLHFASAVDAPVTSIFCSTVPAFGFYPISDASFIVETKENLPCKPCSLHGLKACPLGHFKCAYTIETSQLLQTVSD